MYAKRKQVLWTILDSTLYKHASSTASEILRDGLVFGIKDDKVQERLLWEVNLTLDKTDEICLAAETMVH